jgi:hypothetical protein
MEKPDRIDILEDKIKELEKSMVEIAGLILKLVALINKTCDRIDTFEKKLDIRLTAGDEGREVL